jgi:formate C-acetyltransferase
METAHTDGPARLSAATMHLAEIAASGQWGRQMMPAQVALDEAAVAGLSRERRCAEAIRLVAETVPLRLEPEELLVGASLYVEARYHQVPIAREDSTSHTTLDFALGLREGYEGLRRSVEGRLASGEGDELACDFWQSQLVCLDAAVTWQNRYRDLLRERIATSDGGQRAHYARLLSVCAEVPERAPRTFHEAVQALWFLWEFQRVCGNWPGLGRIDKMLGPYLQADLAAGRLTLDEAREILAHFWVKGTEWRTGQDRGSGDAQNYQNVIVGGVDAEGREVCNEVSFLVLDIVAATRISEFPVTVRLNASSPEALVRRTAEVMRLGGGVVAVYNEDVIIAALQTLGLPAETARTFCNDGCWEIIFPGNALFGYLPFDCMALLQQTLGLGSETANTPPSFEALYADFMARIRETVVDLRRGLETRPDDPGFTSKPSALLCLLMRSCIERGRGYQGGGPELTIYSPHAGGIVDAANSLLVIKELVFEQGELSLPELVDILRADWAGHDALRLRLRGSGHQYGNDESADEMMVRVFEDYTAIVRETAVGAPFLFPAGVSTFGRQIAWAPDRLAAPHGFRGGEFMSNNLSPAPGTDRNGPTAVLHSYCKLDFTKLPNGGPLEIRMHPTMVQGEAGLEATTALLRTLVAQGGFYLSIDVVDAATLRDAQEHPERHRNLSVRIAGWSSHFVTLDEQWQQMIIERTEQRLR